MDCVGAFSDVMLGCALLFGAVLPLAILADRRRATSHLSGAHADRSDAR
jgi:hypothetical protein